MTEADPTLVDFSKPEDFRTVPTGITDSSLIASINETLRTVGDDTIAVVVHVPTGPADERKLRGALYLNGGGGWSFATWVEKDFGTGDKGAGVMLAKRFKPRRYIETD